MAIVQWPTQLVASPLVGSLVNRAILMANNNGSEYGEIDFNNIRVAMNVRISSYNITISGL